MNELNMEMGSVSDVEKNSIQAQNRAEKIEGLLLKFSDLIKENPIIVTYTGGENSKMEHAEKIDKIESVVSDKNGVGDNTGVRFSNGEYIYIRRNAVDASPLFVEGSTGNKITEESFQNILTIMKELIKISGYDNADKEKMFELVVNNFKDSIIKKEN